PLPPFPPLPPEPADASSPVSALSAWASKRVTAPPAPPESGRAPAEPPDPAGPLVVPPPLAAAVSSELQATTADASHAAITQDERGASPEKFMSPMTIF